MHDLFVVFIPHIVYNSFGDDTMRAILSTTPIKIIARTLKKYKSVKEVQDYLMSLDYFCFLKAEKNNRFKPVFDEIAIYRQIFTQPLHIAVMHNQFVYENKGLSKLNYWEYFRNIEELTGKTGEQIPAVPEEKRICQESILLRVQKIFMENNFNKNNYKEITVRKKVGAEKNACE